MGQVRILLLADTHLGIDLPLDPRIKRRRRGIDFFKNYELALQTAFAKKVDLVIHGGDLFYRSKIPDLLISMAFEPLIKIADSGISVLLVAGNHERSVIRNSMFEKHNNIFIFNSLQSFSFDIKSNHIQITGFPCIRKNIRSQFPNLLQSIEYIYKNQNHIHLLCMHQAVEGAQVGVQNYTFKENHDTIRACDIPAGFTAIHSGHIHRAQVLETDLKGEKLQTNVYYPGSIERTSFAEKNEQKGFLILTCIASNNGGEVIEQKFIQLPTRPMVECEIRVRNSSRTNIISEILKQSIQWDKNCIVKIKLNIVTEFNVNIPTLKEIRRVLPESMNILYNVDS
jgi:DNA repair exonuclease SbcCD nuclease subunit